MDGAGSSSNDGGSDRNYRRQSNYQNLDSRDQQLQQQQHQHERGYGVAPAPIASSSHSPPSEQKMYSEDEEWTPSVMHLVWMGLILAVVAAGVGVGIYFASENLNPKPTNAPTTSPVPSSMPSLTPTVAAATGAPSAGDPFVCNICGDSDGGGGTVTLPDVELKDIPTLEDGTIVVTCRELEAAGLEGAISPDECPLLQPLVSEPCGCNGNGGTGGGTGGGSTGSTPPPSTGQPASASNSTAVPTASGTITATTTAAPLFVCPVCGDDNNGPNIGITNPDGVVVFPPSSGLNVTCRELAEVAEKGGVDPNTCFSPDFLEDVQENCLCAYICPLCGTDGGEVTNPDGVVLLPLGQPERTCASLVEAAAAGTLNVQECELLQPLLAGPCGCSSSVRQ